MNIGDLRHPRINILYIPERKQDAQTLYSKYSSLGAKVTLLEVANDNYTRQHLGRLYYFNETSRVKEIAISLARDLRDIESVSPDYVQLPQKQEANYAIWLVRKTKTQTNQIARVVAKPRQTENLKLESLNSKASESLAATANTHMVQCPRCKSSIRNDRLTKHLAKVHSLRKETITVIKSRGPSLRPSKPKTKSAKSQPLNSEYESRIILISRRCTRISKLMPCDSCHSTESVLYRYAESNRGTVHICGRCKSSVFNRSFDKVDAMNLAFQGGAFESNRRRH